MGFQILPFALDLKDDKKGWLIYYLLIKYSYILLFFQLLERDSNKRSSSASKEKGNLPRRWRWLAQPKKVSSYHQFCIIHKLWKTAKGKISGNSKKKKVIFVPILLQKKIIYDCFGLPPININDLVPPLKIHAACYNPE